MCKKVLSFCLFMLSMGVIAQDREFVPMEISVNEFTTGTLLAPNTDSPAVPLVILIQDSGPIDRDGNQPMKRNNAFSHLANKLAEKGIATYRYDKRIFKMRELNLKEKDLRIDHHVSDAEAIIGFFKTQERFGKIVVAGHGEGSLIGMLAAKENADGFISLTGAGQPIHQVLLTQIEQELPGLKKNAETAFRELMEQGRTNSYEPVLDFVFNPKLQPYLLSWMKLDPAEEISKLEIPVLIVGGSLDSQMPPNEAKLLSENKPEAEFVVIENMNHVLRILEVDDNLINAKSYNEPMRPISTELVGKITDFVKNKV